MKCTGHFHGVTADSLGLPDGELVEELSRPSHAWNECLRRLA